MQPTPNRPAPERLCILRLACRGEQGKILVPFGTVEQWTLIRDDPKTGQAIL